MCIVRQYGRTQAQVVGCVLFQIDQKVAVRWCCRIGERLLNERASTGVHLSGQVCELRRVSRVFEHDQFLRVQTDGAALLVFRKQILHEVDDGRVGVVAFLREQVRHATLVSAIRSSSTTSPRLPSVSNDVGSPSSSRMLGTSRFSYADCHSP